MLAHGILSMALIGRVVAYWLGDPGHVIELRAHFASSLPVGAPTRTAVVGGLHVAELRAEGTAVIAMSLRQGDVDVLLRTETLVRLPPSLA